VGRIPERICFFNMTTWKGRIRGAATIAVMINLKASGMLLIWPSVPPKITSVVNQTLEPETGKEKG
jgi:hypothetical protein